jgi:hypothetical protein
MALEDSTGLETAGGRDVFDAGLRGFSTAFPVLRLARAAWVILFRATVLVALPFVLFLAMDALLLALRII